MLCVFPYDDTDDLSLRLCAERPIDWLGRLILTKRETCTCNPLGCGSGDLWIGQGN